MKKNTVVLLYGGGGHETEMRYLVNILDLKSMDVILVTDNHARLVEVNNCNILNHYVVRRLRSYYNNKILSSVTSLAVSVKVFFEILFSYRNITFLSTGPGFTFAICCTLFYL